MKPSAQIGADDADSPQQMMEVLHPNQLNQEGVLTQESFLKPGLSIRVPNREGPGLARTRSETQDLKRSFPILHCQVARLRKEDQQLTEDITEVLDAPKERMLFHHLTSHVGEIFVTTPRLSTPSPLGMRTKSRSGDAWDSATLCRSSSTSSFF